MSPSGPNIRAGETTDRHTKRLNTAQSSPHPLRALILQDNPLDATLMASMLEGGNGVVQSDVADSPESFREHLEKAEYDIILADFDLRDWSVFDALDILKHSGRDVPLIVVTGALNDKAVVECINQGATDYVLKDRPARLCAAVKRAVEEKHLRTETKQALEAVTWLAAIVESSEDAIYGLSPDGVVTSWNQAAERLYGYTSEDIIGRSIALLIPTSHAGEVEDYLDRVKKGEAIEHFETVRVRKDGRAVRVSLSFSPIRNTAGLVIGASAIGRDITERKKAERALARRTQELSRSNAELQQFAYVASHDLQEPLRTVANFAELLHKRYRGKLDAAADEFIDFIVDGVTRMQGLINDLLAYSRVQSRGKESVPADCGALLVQALGNLQAAIAESGVQISHDSLPVVRCDGAQIIQLFQNLVGNSIKFRDGSSPRIHVAVERAAAEWVFSVKDNGIGIDPQYAGRIFEIFQRLHTQKEYAGSGVGLAIAKKIVEQHGGRIWVESQLHQGATFFFTLPVSGGFDVQRAFQFERAEGGSASSRVPD